VTGWNEKANTHDFNADGKSDILWRNGTTLAFWLMNGAAISSSGGISGLPSTWSVVGQRDFNGDGKADLLLRDTSGNIAMWFMNGTAVASSAGVGNLATTWQVAGVADFNGDGIGDILWRDGAGDIAVWLMNGTSVTSSAVIGSLPVATWTVAGTGDFNGDGKADILWRDNLGDIFQALDQATGYLMAAAAIRGLVGRLVRGAGAEARQSLARTANLLIEQSAVGAEPPFAAETEANWSPTVEATAWGPARRVRPPPQIAGTPMAWAHPAGNLGTTEPRWT
jgi:hypothetical protein